MAARTVFMYSGQGSQYFHMTRELYDHHPRYRLWLDYCAEVAEPILGGSLLDVVFDPRRARSDPFDAFDASNAALVCVEYSLTRVAEEMGYRPDVVLGYSLGEITAAVVAEVLPLEDGLTIAVELARLLERRTERAGMLAVIGAADLVHIHAGLFAGCWPAGRNFDGNFVVSGPEQRVTELEVGLERLGILHQRLPVNYGVHTAMIEPARAEALSLLGRFAYAPPRVPIISPVTQGSIEGVSAEHVWSAVRSPVEFAGTIVAMLATGDATFVDLGPSATLATFVRYLLSPGSASGQISTVNRFGNDLKAVHEFRSAMDERLLHAAPNSVHRLRNEEK